MANVAVSASAKFDGSQVVRRAQAKVIAGLAGVTIDRFEVHNDLVGTWEGADPEKAYAGLVPVIGGSARYDLALLTGDLMLENIPTFPNGDEVVFQSPNDDLHRIALKYLADNPSASYDAWLKHIADSAVGFVVAPFSYAARTKKGGRWQNTVFGASKKA